MKINIIVKIKTWALLKCTNQIILYIALLAVQNFELMSCKLPNVPFHSHTHLQLPHKVEAILE